MGVSFFTCQNCKNVSSEYSRIYCEKCESEMCGCAIPEELKKYISIWEDVWSYITTDQYDNIIPAKDSEEDLSELFKKYLTYDGNMYGLEIKEEFCPVCQKNKKHENDPEYEEYLRLKKKFEG